MEGHASIVKLMVEADPSDRHIQNKEGKTPMYIAVEKGYNDIVEIISTTCSAPSLDGPDGSTALCIKNLDQVKSPGGTLYKIMDKDALYAAAIAGDADALAKLEMEADTLDEYGKTILHTESINGNTERVRFILRQFESKNLLVKLDSQEKTALAWAAYYGHTEVVDVLIDAARHLPSSSANNDPVSSFQDFLRHAGKDSETVLNIAARRGHTAIAKLLVEADPSDKHIQNDQGKSPIYVAVEKGYTDIIKVICTTCIAPSLDGPRGSTALHAAIKHPDHDIEVVNLLIGAARHLPPSSDNDNPVTPFQAFLRQCDEELNTALHLAVLNGKVDIVKVLVEADPSDTHRHNNEGKTPIYIAAERGYLDIVKVICTTCRAPSLDGPGGSTVLHAAIKHPDHDIEVVNLLIGAARPLPPSSDEDDEGDEDTQSLVSSSSYSDDEAFNHYLKVTHFQAFLGQCDEELNTALHLAVLNGKVDIVKVLVEADPSGTHTQNNEGKTPIYIAAERGYIDIVKVICTTCTDLTNFDGPDRSTTVLHAAIKNLDKVRKEDRGDVVRLIIEAVKRSINRPYIYDEQERLIALFNEWDEKGCIILELAVEANYLDVVKLILAENPAYNLLNFPWNPHIIGIIPLIYNARDKDYNDMVNLLTQTYQRGVQNLLMFREVPILISAISNRQEESVIRLLNDEYGANLVNFTDNVGWTVLHHAAYHEFDSIIGKIVEAQKSFRHPFVYQDSRRTPFHVAAEKGYTSTVVLLMQLWPSSSSAYTAVDKNGQNILHLAALQSKKVMIQGILKYCSEECKKEFVNGRDNNGDTPLHLLIQRGCLVPELFKYRGLDTWIQNKNNLTAGDMLYSEDQIIEDQAQIKIALDGIQIDQTRGIFSSSVLSSKRERKDVILNKQAKQMMHEKYARMKEDTDAIANCFADAIAGDPISKAALEMKADTLNESEETILHVESKKGNTEHVRFIVMEFANKNLFVELDGSKQTALHLAAHYGHTKVVEVLVGAARPNLPSSSANPVSSFQDFIRQTNGPMRNTALHLAVLNGNVAIVKLLVEADPDDRHVQNNEGKTPIYIAAEKGYKEIVKEICTTCTALSLDGPGGSGKTTALHALIQNIEQVTKGASDVIRMMVDAAKRWSSADPSLVNFKALFSRIDESGSTVLQVAVERNYVDAVRLILQEDPAYQPGPEIKRNGLMRLIYQAMDKKYSDDIIKSLSETYKSGINPDHEGVLDLILDIKRRDEGSVLGHLRNATTLATFKEDNGWTPLHYAVYHEFDSILAAIIEAQHDANHSFVYDDMVPTPFHVAVDHGHTSTVKRLMQSWPAPSSAVTAANSPYTAVNRIGQNILHLAALGNNKEMVAAENKKEMIQGILKYCPEKYKDKILKQQDTNGDTPLHLLISHGCFIPELIKHKGLDTMVRNNRNWTPRDMLYFQSEIVGDQAQIKMALDDMQTGNFFLRSKKKNISESSVVIPSRQAIKDVMFIEHNNSLMDTQMKKGLGIYRKGINSQIVVSTLITTITFTVGFTIPGGLHQSGEVDEGMAVLSKKAAFKAFMVLDALALLLSTCSMFIYFLGTLYEDPYEVFSLHATTTVLNMASVVLMMLIFITGTYVVLSQSLALAITVCVIGSLFFLFVIFQLMKFVYVRRVKKIKD